MKITHVMGMAAALVVLSACQSTNKIDNTAGRATVYEDVSSPGAVQGVGMESQDIVSMTDEMMRDMLQNPQLVNRATAPRIIIDSQYFENQSTSRINKNMLTDRLRLPPLASREADEVAALPAEEVCSSAPPPSRRAAAAARGDVPSS